MAHYRGGQFDPMNGDAAVGQRQRDAPRSDAQLQSSAVSGEVCQRVHRWSHDIGLKQLCLCIVVSLSDGSFEVVVMSHRRAVPRRQIESPGIFWPCMLGELNFRSCLLLIIDGLTEHAGRSHQVTCGAPGSMLGRPCPVLSRVRVGVQSECL